MPIKALKFCHFCQFIIIFFLASYIEVLQLLRIVRNSHLVDVSHFIRGPSEEILIIWTDTRLDEKGTTLMALVSVY